MALEPHAEWLREQIREIEDRDEPQWKLLSSRSGESFVDHDRCQTLGFTADAKADLLVVSVNAVGKPAQEYIPDLELRLFNGESLVQTRRKPSQFQSIRHQRRMVEGSTWQLEVCKDSFDFGRTPIQFTWSLFQSLKSRRR